MGSLTWPRTSGAKHRTAIPVPRCSVRGTPLGNAQAAQGVLEGFSAARTTIVHLPAEVPAIQQEPYDRPTIAIDWTGRPGYAVMPKNALTADNRRTIRWTEVYMGPLTFQILDRAAFHSTLEVLRQIHHTAVAVCISDHIRHMRAHSPWSVCGELVRDTWPLILVLVCRRRHNDVATFS